MINKNHFKFYLKDHKKIKKKLISIIESSPKGNLSPKEYNPYTDYREDSERLYSDILNHSMNDIYNKLLEITGTDCFECFYWYQKYFDEMVHDWHVHPKSHLSSIYYLKLESSDDVTEFFDPNTRQIFQPKVQEGEVIVFPSYIPHRSKKIKGSEKIIISTNYNFSMNDDYLFLKHLQ